MPETSSALLSVYKPMPLRAVAGEGSWIIDDQGHRWLDAYGGHAVASTGHSHPRVVQAICDQARSLLFYSTAVPHQGREALAEALADRCPGDLSRVFFCNSGAEANENAIGLARRFTGHQTIVTLRGGWHGRTLAAVTCTDGARYEETAARAGAPVSRKVEFNDIPALEAALDDSAAAILLEPVQGLQGARACLTEFLRAARDLCDRTGALLIFDEIQCGVGRCDAFTAAEAFGVTPDILTLAKGLASGLPVGAMVTTPRVASALQSGDLGSTFGGGPVPMAAALATLRVLEEENLIANATTVGHHLREGALALGVEAVQGRGLLLGLRLARPAAEVQKALFDHRILTGTSSDPQVLRLMPPLSFSLAEADLVLEALREVLT